MSLQFFTEISMFENGWRDNSRFSVWSSCGTNSTQPNNLSQVYLIPGSEKANVIVTEFTAGSNSNRDSVSSQRCFTVIAARWSNIYSFSVIQPWIKPGYQLTGFNTWMPKSAILEVTLLIYLQNTSPAIRNIAWERDPLEKEASEQKWGAFLSSCWPLLIFSSYVSVGNFSHFFQALCYGSGAECWWGSA